MMIKSSLAYKFPQQKKLNMNRAFLLLGGLFALSIPFYLQWISELEESPLPFSLGIAGSILMWGGAIFYVLRKRFKVFRGLGKMKTWLNVHILLCLFGPMMIIYHSRFSIRAPNSAVATYAMLAMVFSGFIGRYFYKHFQISLSGERASLREMEAQSDTLEAAIERRSANAPQLIEMIKHFFSLSDAQREKSGFITSVIYMIKLDWFEKKLWLKLSGVLPNLLEGAGEAIEKREQLVLQEMLRKRVRLGNKIALLKISTRLFSHWHAFHVPLIFILFLTFVFHVMAVLIF